MSTPRKQSPELQTASGSLKGGASPQPAPMSLKALMTRQRWIEVARIVFTGIISLLFWQQLLPTYVL